MSRRQKCGQHPDSRSLNSEELSRLETEFWDEQQDPAGAKARRVAAAKERQSKAWVPPQDVQGEEEYRMNFGKHCVGGDKTIKEVSAQDPGYFKWLVSGKSDILDVRPDLKAALDKEGLLQDLLTQRPELQKQRAEKILMRPALATWHQQEDFPSVL